MTIGVGSGGKVGRTMGGKVGSGPNVGNGGAVGAGSVDGITVGTGEGSGASVGGTTDPGGDVGLPADAEGNAEGLDDAGTTISFTSPPAQTPVASTSAATPPSPTAAVLRHVLAGAPTARWSPMPVKHTGQREPGGIDGPKVPPGSRLHGRCSNRAPPLRMAR